ncbi:MAG: hypothetical protein GEU83_20865 [Pseudonocardiaceae bacterium]|nr:hypothetical protein [Pseudonocardiaceae bacterium]
MFTDGEFVTKPLAKPAIDVDEPKIAYTHLLSDSDIGDLRGIDTTGHMFQRWIAKRSDLRVTAVGDHIFATALHAHSNRSRIDWRSDYDSLEYEPVGVPSEVRAGVLAYLRSFGLIFGAFDFAVDKSGFHWFLECNPNGQWGFIEYATGQPIAAAIAAELTRGPHHG